MPVAPEYLHLVYPGRTPFNALLYGRNSRDPKKKGSSVSDQLSTGRLLCNTHDWNIAHEFKDTGISASRHAKKRRDEFEDLLDAIEEGRGNIVVAFEASRYYRDLEVYVRLRNACLAANVLLCYDNQVYDLSKRGDRKMTAQDAIAAEDEAEGIRDRNVRTVELNAQAGKPHGKIPFGYIRRYDPATGDLIGQFEDPQRGPQVVAAMERFDSGDSLTAVVEWLQDTPDAARADGVEWTTDLARYMLMNPAYVGQRVHQGSVLRRATWDPLKGLETAEGQAMFRRVAKRLTDPERRTQQGNQPKHLLSCIALCGECGDHAILTKFNHTNGSAMYSCQSRHDTSIKKDALDAYVEEALFGWLADKPKARAALVPDDSDVRAASALAQEQVDQLTAQLEEARGLATQLDENNRPRLSVASLASLEAALQPQIDEARARVERVTGTPVLIQRLLSAPDPEAVWNGTDMEPGLTLDQRREAVRSIVTVRLFKAAGSRRVSSRVQLAWAGEPGFRDRPLRVRGNARARVIGLGTE
ncbi:hypothetical protein SGFS_065010 [Streptomyces graminofaciens]|uniref:Recombinase domain-containing protein n=1 Tax=Streptomyces graminofaciens TaxID=68212 RepID=A0ABM7FF92_9ACTN|nr:recombinase family protein [Streptomyces graminofaciens]BBC35207.1 hypothetical protein SGFS_065010 [Streptomyces graminofaciens]